MKAKHLLILFISLVFVDLPVSFSQTKKQTQVLVIGTIHSGHNNNPNYSDQHLINILGTYNPDVICVEIPPSYFRKQSYLKEMMIASIYGFDKGKKVYPIDWKESISNARSEREAYKQTDDYKIKEKIVDSLVNANQIMQSFIKKYGNMSDIWKENKMGYEFFNGKDYNNYTREMYNITISVYGDGCMNLYSELRNLKMMELINKAIEENQGKRVIIFTGAEHKYYFDIALSKQKDIKLIQLEEILPLKQASTTKNLTDFIEKNLARGYYDVSEALAIDVMYSGATIPLIHAMGMDDTPSIIPPENIEKAYSVLKEWEEQSPQSVTLQFEKAWIKFLEKKYNEAIKISENISEKLDKTPQEKRWFYKAFFWRNLAFCYDMLGERQKAVEAYRKCKAVCIELKINENFAKNIYKNYETESYTEKKE